MNRSTWYALSRWNRHAASATSRPGGHQAHEPGPRDAGHRHHRDDQHAEHHRGAEVRLKDDQAHGQPGQREGGEQVTGAGRGLPVTRLAEHHREQHDQPELGELRRLELEPGAHLDPRVVALDRGAERREHRDQAHARRRVQERRVRAHEPVVQQRDPGGQDQADRDRDEVFLQEALGVAARPGRAPAGSPTRPGACRSR